MKHMTLLHSDLAGRGRQRGLAMVEFAIGAPILLLLLLAVGEFGRMLSHYNVLLQSSRDAARYASHHALNRTIDEIVLSRVEPTTSNLAIYGSPNTASATLLPGLNASNVQVSTAGSEHVQVTIRYVFRPVIGNVLPTFFGKDIPLNVELVATSVMRAL
ncbi:TadE-like protein [compost metagenome]